MKIVAFLPAKGSSSRIESKNLKLLDGKPLFLHTLEKLMKCDFIDEVYLDTESEEIISYAKETGCKILKRSPELASNSTNGNQLFMNEVRQVDADIYIQILCTSPFIELDTILKGIQILKDNYGEFDSVVLCKNEKLYTWDGKFPQYDLINIPNSIDLKDTTIETMGLYVIKREAAITFNRRIGEKPFLLNASSLEAIDVNFPEDFRLANLIAAGIREKDRKLMDNIRNILSSSMLSDVLDDFGYKNQVIKDLLPNISGNKFLGRAKTLKIRELRPGEDFKGIYEALYSYETIVPNDVILVQNTVPDYAYFGDLNANLAIRSGASAVVIDGKTRDSNEVSKMGLPVYSRGYTCQDVRNRGTLESVNKKITIRGVEVSPGDLIYGDIEGVISIPSSIEKIVIDEIYKRARIEKSILVDISLGIEPSELVVKHGFF